MRPAKNGVAVPEHLRDGHEELVLHPPLPHLDQRAVLRVRPHERRLGLHLLEVAADGDALGDGRAVVELEHRHASPWVLRPELRRRGCARVMMSTCSTGTGCPSRRGRCGRGAGSGRSSRRRASWPSRRPEATPTQGTTSSEVASTRRPWQDDRHGRHDQDRVRDVLRRRDHAARRARHRHDPHGQASGRHRRARVVGPERLHQAARPHAGRARLHRARRRHVRRRQGRPTTRARRARS